ncbi:hypothetical protein [Alishewanella longhuensis]
MAQQRLYWAIGFVSFVLGLLLLLWQLLVSKTAATLTKVAVAPLSLQGQPWWRWLALSVCGVVLLLAVTQQLTPKRAAGTIFYG